MTAKVDPCQSTRHCADHGWCHRCAPGFAALMSRVNEVIDKELDDTWARGRLYAALGQLLYNAGPSASGYLLSPPADLPPFSGGDEDEADCPKCGYTRADTEYKTPEQPPEGAVVGIAHAWPERLERCCQRCGYRWDEAPVPPGS